MKLKKNGAIRWLEFEQLQEFPEVVHGVFLRHGGRSKEPFASLNAGGSTGDDPIIVEQNRQLILNCLGLKELISSKQSHGIHIEEVPSISKIIDEGCDGLVTKQRGLGLMIKHADCQAALFYDPNQKVIANVHCGWRGNVQNIYEKTIVFLQTRMGCNPANILVCISPSLGPQAAQFLNHAQELPEAFSPFQHKPNYFDFWSIARFQLEQAGILPKHIEIAEMCTYSQSEDFFSYRREKKTGRHATIVALR